MKLMLVDDHALFIEGLSYLLKTYGFEVTCVANSGEEALEQAAVHQPEAVLMDICMPGLSGFDTLRLLKAQYPAMKVVMLTASEGDEDLFQAIKYGADGYLLKSTGAAELVEALQGIRQGETALSSSLAARLLDELENCQTEEKTDSTLQLTPRQLEILQLVAQGVSYKDVAEALGLTERTIKYHMGNIVQILHLENRSQVIAHAAKLGIIKDV
jgi:two-component system NarL family response regulator